MQVNSALHTPMATQTIKSGSNLPLKGQDFPPTQEAQNSRAAQEKPTIRELAKSIDPSNMSRNESRDIALALGRAGQLEIDDAFAMQSMVLVNENGQLRNATETDAIMNEKFNMFETLQNQIEFNKLKGLSTASLEKGLEFLEKFKISRENPEVNIYA